MNSSDSLTSTARPLRRVLILADQSADWRVAGFAPARSPRALLAGVRAASRPDGCLRLLGFAGACADGVVAGDGVVARADFRRQLRDFPAVTIGPATSCSARVCFSIATAFPSCSASSRPHERNGASAWSDHVSKFENAMRPHGSNGSERQPWQILRAPDEIPACERTFLRHNGKSQDGLVSRHLNRRVSRAVSRWLLKLPIVPSAWSVFIFILPLLASFAFVKGTYCGVHHRLRRLPALQHSRWLRWRDRARQISPDGIRPAARQFSRSRRQSPPRLHPRPRARASSSAIRRPGLDFPRGRNRDRGPDRLERRDCFRSAHALRRRAH